MFITRLETGRGNVPDQQRHAHCRTRSSPQSKRTSGRHLLDRVARTLSALAALSAVVIVTLTTILLLRRAWPLLAHQSLAQLLGGTTWAPHHDTFGFAPFIAGSMAVTLVAMLFAVIPAVLSGIYLAEYTSSRTRSLLKPMLDLLVGIPSVVFGLWGILVIVPVIRDTAGPLFGQALGQSIPLFAFTNTSGYSVLAAGAVLAVMVFPLIVAVVDEVLRSTPQEMRESLLSLGATKWEATALYRPPTAGCPASLPPSYSASHTPLAKRWPS